MHGVSVRKGVNLLFHSPSCLFMVRVTWQLSGKRARAHSLYKDGRLGTLQDTETRSEGLTEALRTRIQNVPQYAPSLPSSSEQKAS